MIRSCLLALCLSSSSVAFAAQAKEVFQLVCWSLIPNEIAYQITQDPMKLDEARVQVWGPDFPDKIYKTTFVRSADAQTISGVGKATTFSLKASQQRTRADKRIVYTGEARRERRLSHGKTEEILISCIEYVVDTVLKKKVR